MWGRLRSHSFSKDEGAGGWEAKWLVRRCPRPSEWFHQFLPGLCPLVLTASFLMELRLLSSLHLPPRGLASHALPIRAPPCHLWPIPCLAPSAQSVPFPYFTSVPSQLHFTCSQLSQPGFCLSCPFTFARRIALVCDFLTTLELNLR